jgi:oligosaccharide repeat unit polymerase
MNTVWRRLFAPEVIFAASTIAALSPYLLWYLGYKPPGVQRLDLTFLPALVWGCGFTSFLVGSRLIRNGSGTDAVFRLRQQNLPITFLLYAGLAVILAQVYLAVKDVYGVVPLLDYLSSDGAVDVGAANDQQQYSGYGQLGLFTASLYALNSLLLLAMLQWLTWRRGSRVLIGLAVLTVAFAHLLNAKRQGLYSALFYILVGLSIYSGSPTRAFAALLPWARSRTLAKICLGSLAIILVVGFGYIASIRTRGRVEASTDEIVTYLQYPLVNFEAQCLAAGIGPGDFTLLGPLRNLAPYKYAGLADSFTVTIPKRILSAPSGIYEYIHWYWGITGVMLYSLVLGIVSRWLYDRTLGGLTYLLCYCYFAVALAMAHSNNQVLILSYVPVPVLFVFLLKFAVFTERVRLPGRLNERRSGRRGNRMLFHEESFPSCVVSRKRGVSQETP